MQIGWMSIAPNAVCVQLLGRADNVRDFVRRGESSGFVQIWLTTGKVPNNIVNIRRTLDARENSSEWRINGALRLCKRLTHKGQRSAICVCLVHFIRMSPASWNM